MGFSLRCSRRPWRNEDRCRELRLHEVNVLGAEVASRVLQSGNPGWVFRQRHQRPGDRVHRQGNREAQRIAIGPIDLIHTSVEEVVKPIQKMLFKQRGGIYLRAEEGQDLLTRARRAQALFFDGCPVRFSAHSSTRT